MWWKLLGVVVMTGFAGYQAWRGLTKGRVLGRYGSDIDRAKSPISFWAMLLGIYALWIGLVAYVGVFYLAQQAGLISN